MTIQDDILFTVLEYNKHLPKLDLHGLRPDEVEGAIVNFLVEKINADQTAVQIIYGRGGAGRLKEKTVEFLQKNMAETNPAKRFVKAWKGSVLEGAGGRCIVLLED